MAVAVGIGNLTVSYTETLDVGVTDRLATITVKVTRTGEDDATALIDFPNTSNMTPAQLTDYQAFVDVVDEQVTHLLAALDAVAVQAGA